MNKKEMFKSLVFTILIILLGILDYHVSCVYLKYIGIQKDLRLMVKSCGLAIDITSLILMIQIIIIYKIYDYKKNRIVLIYPKI